jgi:hypothetical protein
MPTHKRKSDFFETDEGVEVEQALRKMAIDLQYNTASSYSANSEQYPDNLIPFVEKHKAYLRNHPTTDPWHYLSNLRLMTRFR